MSKYNTFLKAFKSLNLRSGEKIVLYKNEYTVISSNDKLTLMKNAAGHPCAYPTEKLKSIMLNKALISNKNSGIIAGSEKGTSSRTQSGAGMGVDPKKMHSGKIRVDKVDSKGHKYHYWVDAQHGTKYESHDSTNPHPNQIDEVSKLHYSEMNSIIHKYAADEDVPKLQGKLDEYVKAKSAYIHLEEAHNQLAKEHGTGFPSSTLNNLATKQDDYERKFNILKTALKQSKDKKGE